MREMKRYLSDFAIKPLCRGLAVVFLAGAMSLIILLGIQALPALAQTPETISDAINNSVSSKPKNNQTQSANLPLEEQVKKIKQQLAEAEDQLKRLAEADPTTLATQFAVTPQDVQDKKKPGCISGPGFPRTPFFLTTA